MIIPCREPDYSTIKMGSRVLAKQKNKLWHRCVILKISDDKDDEYQVKFEASGNVTDVGIHDLLPLGNISLTNEFTFKLKNHVGLMKFNIIVFRRCWFGNV